VASVADAALAASVASATNATPAASAAIGATSPAASPALAGIAGFVDTAVWDLASATFETRKELTAYCERWAAAMFETAAAAPMPNSARLAANLTSNKALGAVEATAATAAAAAAATADTDATNTPPSPWKTLGAAVHEIELLADLARDARMGRLRVPLDELDRAGVDTNALAKLPWPIPLATLLRERHEALRATIAKCLSAIGREEQMALRGLLVWVALTWRLSVRAQNALPSVILPRRYDALAEGWQAWRAARRATAGHLRLS
jgi:phytoene/squalene synthetase